MNGPASLALPAGGLYAEAYRPVVRDGAVDLDTWAHTLAVGDPLPTLPLRLVGDFFLPVNLDATYQEMCRRRKLV